jgi:hypothetical protein
MAHFAELDGTNTVLRVVVVHNEDIKTPSGYESEEMGIGFCQNLFGGTWIQTSYNGKIRKNFAGIGFTYDAERDAFIPPKPVWNPSWVLDEDTLTWTFPIPEPTIDRHLYRWEESTVSWVLKTNPPPQP